MLDVVDGARPPLKRSTPSTSERRDRHTGKASCGSRDGRSLPHVVIRTFDRHGSREAAPSARRRRHAATTPNIAIAPYCCSKNLHTMAVAARCSVFGVVLLLSMIAAAAMSQAFLRGERLSQLSGQETNQPRWPRSSPGRIQTASNRTGVERAQSNRLTSRSLADVDGKTACADCSGSSKKCVGRTIEDAQCDACSKGQVSHRGDSALRGTFVC